MTSTLEKTWGRVLAVTAISAASLVLAGCSLLGGGEGNVEGEGEETDVFTIAIGDCLNDSAAEGEVSAVPTVPCDEPHDSEAYATHDLADGDYPAQEAMFAEADAACEAEFEGFVGLPYAESALAYSYYFPTEESWADGDREILCVVIELDDAGNPIQTTGSLQNSGK